METNAEVLVKKRPLVFLASPSYGSIEPELTLAVLQAGRGVDVLFSSQKLSLLAMNFNMLWCQALNNRHIGFDYFAMMHTDIYPLEQGWLEHMIQLLHESEADILSVIAPLKDDRGLTSAGYVTTLDKKVRRLTLKEVFELPETFTVEALGKMERKLVMNTGLWVADFTKPWVEKVHFQIHDNIVKTEEGIFKAVTLPEDWDFSLQCANLGVEIALTRAIPIKHFGRYAYENTSVWGTQSTDLGDG